MTRIRLSHWPAVIGARAGFRADMLAFLAGGAAALALPPVHAIPALVPAFLVLIVLLDATTGLAEAARRGWWFGFGLHLAGLYWVTEAILVEAERYWWLVPFAAPALAAVLAVFVALTCALSRLVHQGWRRVVALSGGWGMAELARQFVLTGFPWNPLGSVWAAPGSVGDVMIQPAAWIGVHGLTVVTVGLASFVMRGRASGLACLAVFFVWAGSGLWRLRTPEPEAPALTVVIAQGNIPQGEKWNRERAHGIFARYLELTREGIARAGDGPMVVVWPEAASPFLLEADTAARAAITEASDGWPALVGGIRFGADGRPRNALFALLDGGLTAAIYDKWHLVPFGEYQPTWLPAGVQLVPGGGFAAGEGPRSLAVPGLPPFGPLICYEAIFPSQVVAPFGRPEWLVNVTNDAWFGNSSGPRQHLASARMRAVEEGLPLVRAANTGISAIFDAKGREVTRLGINATGVLVARLPVAVEAGLYARLGLVIPTGISGALIALCFMTNRRFASHSTID